MVLIGFPITFLTAFLLEKIKVQYMLAIVFTVNMISILLLQQVELLQGAILFDVIWSINVWMKRITLGIVRTNYFGRQHLGNMSGYFHGYDCAGSVIGPLPFGSAYDQFRGYETILWGMKLFPALGIMADLLSITPKKEV